MTIIHNGIVYSPAIKHPYSEEYPIHPSGSDCAVTYPSMINYGDDKIMVAWSKYEINESEHKGEICYCIVKIEEDSSDG